MWMENENGEVKCKFCRRWGVPVEVSLIGKKQVELYCSCCGELIGYGRRKEKRKNQKINVNNVNNPNRETHVS